MIETNKKATSAPERSLPPLSTTTARAIVAACLIASFLVPYLAVSAFQAHNYRQWAASGLNHNEIDEWREAGFIDVQKALRWKAADFKPQHALIWRREGFGPEEAGAWNGVEFHPGEARIWGKNGFSADEAKAWKDNGFYYAEAGDWKTAGASPSEAAARKKKGKRPEERRQNR